MKKRLLALLVTALVLSTMAVAGYADYTSEWITTRNWVQDTSFDSTVPVKITVTVARDNPTLEIGTSATFFSITRRNTTTTDNSHGTIEELFQECYVNYVDLTSVFINYTMYLGSVTSGTGDYIEIRLGPDFTEGTDGLKSGVRWRYTIEEITTTDDGYQDGYNAGYEEGYTAGDTAGYDRGYTAGDTAGYNRGYNVGYEAGVASGGNNGTYQDGYNAGYEVGYTAGDTAGYNRGYNVGYTQGQADADPQGEYAQGFADGKAQGQADADIALNFMDGFFSGLTGFFTPFLNMGIGPLTIGGMLTLMVIAVIVIIIVKVVRG